MTTYTLGINWNFGFLATQPTMDCVPCWRKCVQNFSQDLALYLYHAWPTTSIMFWEIRGTAQEGQQRISLALPLCLALRCSLGLQELKWVSKQLCEVDIISAISHPRGSALREAGWCAGDPDVPRQWRGDWEPACLTEKLELWRKGSRASWPGLCRSGMRLWARASGWDWLACGLYPGWEAVFPLISWIGSALRIPLGSNILIPCVL